MGVAGAIGLDPVSALVQEFVRTLHERAQGIEWRSTPQGLAADIFEGEVLLAPLPGPTASWRLTVVFHAASESDQTGADPRAPVERGRRVIGWGALGRMQQRALELAMCGVPGGPSFTGGPMVWHRAAHNGSLRLNVPSGELRISPIDDSMCTLTHEDGSGVELLSVDTEAELQRQAFPMCMTRATRPLQVRVHGRRVNLRSLGVAGVLGYHELKDHSFIVLALVRGDILLLHVRGIFHRILGQLSWADLMFGEPLEVQPASRAGKAAYDRDPSYRAEAPTRNGDQAANLAPVRSSADEGLHVEASPALRNPPTAATMEPPEQPPLTRTPMAERHRELCRRYFRRLHRRLTGRGARKARELVLLILEMLDEIQEDITGSRLEVHARLERILVQRLRGGPRNIRDCLDLLGRHSPFVRAEPDKRCTLRFGELHNPESELMRFIAAEDEREELAANSRPVTIYTAAQEAEPPIAPPAAAPETGNRQAEPLVPELAPKDAIEMPSATASSEWKPDVSRELEPWMVEVFRHLGHAPAQAAAQASVPTSSQSPPSPTPGLSSSTQSRPLTVAPGGLRPSPHVIRGFVRRGTYFLGQYVDDDDETDAPSRFRGRTDVNLPGIPSGSAKPKTDKSS